MQILDDKDTWDHPNVIYLAAEIVSEYGTILEKTSDLTMGVSEKHLPYSKIEIEKAIIILLRFLNSQNSWSKLKEKYNDLAKIIITDKYYGTLRRGYIELAKFISDEEGTICEKASLLLIEAESQGKSVENVAEEIRAPWFKKAIQINQQIIDDSVHRLKVLQENFGKESVLFTE